MSYINTYTVGIDVPNKMYFIDANILIAMSKFYYDGFYYDERYTEEIKEFVLFTRNIGINCDYAIIELCYDYNTDSINTDMLNAFMIAFDNLIMNFAPNEFISYKGSNKAAFSRKIKQSCPYKSIFECNLPKYLFKDEIGTINLFYQTYLYMLKLNKLYFADCSPIKKVRTYYKYMINEIDIFLGLEFFIGVMLLIGSDEQNKISAKILKPNKDTNLMKFLNPIIDIMNYRKICLVSDWSMKLKEPMQAIFATSDKGLQHYIELNKKYNSVISPTTITPIVNFKLDINPKYAEEWDVFYYNEYLPCIQKRSFDSHLSPKTEEYKNQRLNRIINEIEILEKQVFR